MKTDVSLLAFVACSVVALVLGSPAARAAEPPAADPIPALIITGENNHDWKKTTPVLEAALEETGRFRVDVVEKLWEEVSAEKLEPYAVIVLNFNAGESRWSDEQAQAFLDAFRVRGKGAVVVHAANNAFPGWREYDELIGGGWRKGAGHGAFHPFRVDVVDREHPITRGLPRSFMQAPDELYHRLTMLPGRRVLAQAYSDPARGGTSQYEPMAWVHAFGRARVFHTPLGHAPSSMESPGFKTLLARGAEWAATSRVTLPSLLPEWEALFNGEDLSGWRGDPELWKVVDGAIVGDSPGIRHNAFLVSERRFADFVLELEVRLEPDTENSGIQFRSEPLPNGEMYGYQADVGRGWWGSLYDESTGRGLLVNSYEEKGSRAVKPGEWNRYRVEAIGNRVRIAINDVVTADFTDDADRPDGHIALQVHSGGAMRVAFRDLRITER